jgi:hypothetical protein
VSTGTYIQHTASIEGFFFTLKWNKMTLMCLDIDLLLDQSELSLELGVGKRCRDMLNEEVEIGIKQIILVEV